MSVIEGGPGNDYLGEISVNTNDTLLGLGGNDQIDANDGDNLLRGGDGNDYLSDGGDNDVLHGDDGDDALYYHAGSNFLYGGNGDDELIYWTVNWDVTLGTNALYGGAGNDSLHGSVGDDLLDPGEGRTDVIYGSEGNDTVDLANIANPEASYHFIKLYWTDISTNISMHLGASSGTIDKGASGTDTLIGEDRFSDAEFAVFTGSGNDSIVIDRGDDLFIQVDTGVGEDSITALSGFVRVSYANATTSIVYTSNNGPKNSGTVIANNESDTLVNVSEIRGSEYDDIFNGGEGDERFILNGGDDTVEGGAGFDHVDFYRPGVGAVNVDLTAGTASGDFYGYAFNSRISSIERVWGSYEGDTLSGSSADESFGSGSGNDHLSGLGGNDTLNGAADNDTLYGGDGADEVYGGSGDDFVQGNAGSDYSQGNSGNDTVRGGGDNDTVRGGQDDDFVKGDKGIDRVQGDKGNDFVRGGKEGDTVRGGQGNDTVYGDKGNDTIFGDLDNDTLYGGDDADLFVIRSGDGSDVIKDFDFTEGDRLEIRAGYSSSEDGSGVTLNIDGGGTVFLEDASGFSDDWVV